MGKKSKKQTATKSTNAESVNTTLSTTEIASTTSAIVVDEASNRVSEVSVAIPVKTSEKTENCPVVHDEYKSMSNADELTKDAGKRKRNKKNKGMAAIDTKSDQVKELDKAKESTCLAHEVIQTATKPDKTGNHDKLNPFVVDLVKASIVAKAPEVKEKEGGVVQIEESSSIIETEKTKGGKKNRKKNKKPDQTKETSNTADPRTETSNHEEDQLTNKTQLITFETAVINSQDKVKPAAEIISKHETRKDVEVPKVSPEEQKSKDLDNDKTENCPVVHIHESKSSVNAEELKQDAGKRKRNKKKKGSVSKETQASHVDELEKAKDSVCPPHEVLQTTSQPDKIVNQNNDSKTSTLDLVKTSTVAKNPEVTKKEKEVIRLEEPSSNNETEKTKGGKKKRNKNKKSVENKETPITVELRTETTNQVESQITSSKVDVPKLEQKDEESNEHNQCSDNLAAITQDVTPVIKIQPNMFETAAKDTQDEVMQTAEVTSDDQDTKKDVKEVASEEHESNNIEEEKVQKKKIYSLSKLLEISKTITLVKPQLQGFEMARATPHKQPVVFEMPQVSSTARWASLPIESNQRKAFLGIDHKNVVLHKSSAAWQTTKKDVPKSKEEVESIMPKLRGLLNKLSPDNFGKILNEIRGISFDTLEKLAGFIKQLFEKAVGEPGFSPTYARLALSMSLLSVQDGDKTVSFKTLIIRECQAEFEKDKRDEKILNDLTEKISSAKTDAEKKLLTDEKQMAIFKAKRRSIGNIKFIGELFKLSILSESIVITCINKLMQKPEDEESMECVCQLLSTIGKTIDSKSKTKLDVLMNELNQLVAKKTTSSRIRFMIMDVTDLRKSGWVTKNNQVPITIEQVIQKDTEREKQRTTTYENRPSYRAGPYRAKKDEGSPFFRDFLASHVKTGKDIKKVKKVEDDIKKPQTSVKRSKFDALRKLCTDEDEKPRKKISVNEFPKNGSSESAGKSFEEVKRLETVSPVPEQKVISRNEMELKVKSRIDEFLSLKDLNEALESIKELNTEICHANAVRFFYISFSQNFEKSSEVRNQIGQLHRNVLDKKIASVEAYVDASIKFSNFASDMVVDIPQIWTYISELVTPAALESEVIKIDAFVRGSTFPDAELDEDLCREEGDYTAMLLAAFLNGVSSTKGKEAADKLWADSGLKWESLLKHSSIDEFKQKFLKF